MLTVGKAGFCAGSCVSLIDHFLVTQGRNHFLRSQHRVAAITMDTVGQSCFRAGCCIALVGHFIMAQCCHFLSGIGITAGTGVGGVTLFRAGGGGDHSGMVVYMIQLGNHFRLSITAGCTGIGTAAGGFLGRFFCDLSLIVGMTGSRNGLLLDQNAVAAIAMLTVGQSCFRAGCRIALIGHFIMAQRCHFVSGIGITAGTGIGGVTLFRAGGGGHRRSIGMVTATGIVCLGHGVSCMEGIGVITIRDRHLPRLIPAVMIREVVRSLQEALIDGKSRIPGGVQVVIFTIQPGNVPNMTLSLGIAWDHAAIHTQFQRQPVEQRSITLADSGLIDQRRIGSVFQLVAVVVKIIIIVSNIGGYVVINCLQLGVVILTGHIQLAQQLVNGGIHLSLLGRIGVVGHSKGSGSTQVLTTEGVIAKFHIKTGILPQQIVTFHRISGMGHSAGHNGIDLLLRILLHRVRIVGEGDIHRNGGISGNQVIPDHLAGGFRIVILAAAGVICIQKWPAGLYQVIFGHSVGIQGVYAHKAHIFRQFRL